MKAIELLEEYKDIALVITDIQMQKMGGLELASYLHKHIPEIDVLILTAFENFDYAREPSSFRMGCSTYADGQKSEYKSRYS